MPGFEMDYILKPMLCFPIEQKDGPKCEQQRKQTGGNDDGKQVAHVRLEPSVVLR